MYSTDYFFIPIFEAYFAFSDVKLLQLLRPFLLQVNIKIRRCFNVFTILTFSSLNVIALHRKQFKISTSSQLNI